MKGRSSSKWQKWNFKLLYQCCKINVIPQHENISSQCIFEKKTCQPAYLDLGHFRPFRMATPPLLWKKNIFKTSLSVELHTQMGKHEAAR